MVNDINETLKDGTRLYGWKSLPPLTPFAPDYAYYFSEKRIFSEAQCEEWNEYLLEQEEVLLDKFRTSPGDGSTGLGGLSITSRFRNFNLLEFDFVHVDALKKALYDGMETIFSVSDNTSYSTTLNVNSWFNVLRQGEEMQTHFHGYHKNTLYAFHVSIAAKKTFTTYFHPIKYQEQRFHVPNKIGYLTLFPNFIPHNVSPNRYEIPRVSIAGDICPSTWLDEPSAKRYYPTVLIGTYGKEV